ncbi:Elongation of very long chain fatty acids protein [Caenorhabditis elegans]|uniref:Elongation of very long chain fatty acids protein n=2 Tax=Caenorhabditis elegans TaxID=6239 RepID=F3Y5R4_CAEEL|nr:Elongation of very long chain fatty acids protein [Caenorhabditis elegans]CCA65659.1 Elongation of very long chain fatty acids protein [Caenorhabditis elegans]|eukprot:NP_001255110.1 Elongation of very long chain fatty acids protein [Caenorhabditis elegans]
MFPYSWLSSTINWSLLPIHLLGIFYVFVAFNFRPSHISDRSYLKEWYYYNCVFQLGLGILMIPEILTSSLSGWHYSVCHSGTLYTGFFSGSVVAIWTFTKVVDLLETMLLLYDARRPLTIHIIHHFLSLSFAFTFYSQNFALHRWIVFFNLTAHVFLYAYLSGFKILNRWTPCWVAVCSSQMLQLILPFIATFSAAAKLARGTRCDANALGLLTLQIGLGVLIILFAEFYWSRVQAFRKKNMKSGGGGTSNSDSSEQESEKVLKKLKARRPSDETVMFENDFPELRSVIFSP